MICNMPCCLLFIIFAIKKCLYRQQVTIIEIFPPPVMESPPSAAVTPSSMCSPANGMSPSTSSDPSPSLDSRVSVIVNVNNTPVVSNKYVAIIYYCVVKLVFN